METLGEEHETGREGEQDEAQVPGVQGFAKVGTAAPPPLPDRQLLVQPMGTAQDRNVFAPKVGIADDGQPYRMTDEQAQSLTDEDLSDSITF